MITIKHICTLTLIIACCPSLKGQITKPKWSLECGGGVYGFDTRMNSGIGVRQNTTAKWRPSGSILLKYQRGKLWEIAWKCGWFRTAHFTSYYDQFENDTWSKELYNIYCTGIVYRFILFSRYKIKLKPELQFQICKRILSQTYISDDGLIFTETNPIKNSGYETDLLSLLYGFSIQASYDVTYKFSLSIAANLQTFRSTDFGPNFGLTAGVSYNFNR